jgi:D-alanyl-lipoteichoic acid acyltransferase DltB (MBOAT superfamily)
MLFPTIDFAVFFAVVFPITWLLNEYNTWKKLFLVAASYFFYAYWRLDFTLLLFSSSLFNYLVALGLGRMRDGALRLALLWFSILCNLGVLGYFKYYNFFAATFANAMDALGLSVQVDFIEVALPVAISFLTFHAISYTVDVYRRETEPSRSLIDILLYISFFPHLIAGPIVRAKRFLAQTRTPRNPGDIRLGQSVLLILGGLFKKVIVANYLSTEFVDAVFRNPLGHSSLDLFLGMHAYALQIYCDFSAYTDIAIGVANLLGYEFPQNFNYPYRATSVQDFWRRWHMSLSSWLRDYLYIPLGGNRGGEWMTYRNIMITMVLGGLWHGASWNFLIWGFLHGTALVAECVFGWIALGKPEGRSWGATVLGWLVTLEFVCITWVFFRTDSFATASDYFSTMMAGGSWSTTLTPFAALIFVLGALSHIVPPRWFATLERRYDTAPLPTKVLIPFATIFLVCVAAPTGIAPFIYFQF